MILNILVVHNYYRIPGGEDTVVANEVSLLREHGHKVVLYTRSNNELSFLKGVAKLRKLLLPIITIYNPRTSRDIKKIIKEEKIDVVHVHNTLNLISPSVYYAAIKSGVKVVQTIHNFRLLCPAATFYREKEGGKDCGICEDCVKKGLSCAVCHKCYRGSFAETLCCVILLIVHRFTGIYKKINYICLTEFNKQKLLESAKIFGFDSEKEKSSAAEGKRIFVKPNFADSQCVGTGNEGYFLFAGRLDKLKGIDFLLKAWKEDMPQLRVCGTGPLDKWCRDYLTDNPKSNVELLGFVNHDEVMNLMKNAAGVILPTRWYEGFPMTIVESYSVGTPVVASNLGNAGALVTDNVTGYRFAMDDEKSLKSAINAVVSGSDRLRKSTINEFVEKYTADKNYEQLTEIYGDSPPKKMDCGRNSIMREVEKC